MRPRGVRRWRGSRTRGRRQSSAAPRPRMWPRRSRTRARAPWPFAAAGTASPGAPPPDGVVIDVAPDGRRRSSTRRGRHDRRRCAARPTSTTRSTREGARLPAGCGPEVGIAGLTLGGGLGMLGRTHGLTATSSWPREVVLADGSVVEASEEPSRSLFWALRGAGGGQFGVVTDAGRCGRLPRRRATSIHLSWPLERAARVIDGMAGVVAGRAGRDGGEPAVLTRRRRSGVHVARRSASSADAAGSPAAAASLAESRGIRRSSQRQAPYRETKGWLAEHGPGEGPPGGHDHSQVGVLPASAPGGRDRRGCAEILAADGAARRGARAGTHALGRGLQPGAGGATALRPPRRALPAQAGRRGRSGRGSERRAEPGWRTRGRSSHPYGSRRRLPQLPGPRARGLGRAYHGDEPRAARAAKAAYDPQGVFPFAQSV